MASLQLDGVPASSNASRLASSPRTESRTNDTQSFESHLRRDDGSASVAKDDVREPRETDVPRRDEETKLQDTADGHSEDTASDVATDDTESSEEQQEPVETEQASDETDEVIIAHDIPVAPTNTDPAIAPDLEEPTADANDDATTTGELTRAGGEVDKESVAEVDGQDAEPSGVANVLRELDPDADATQEPGAVAVELGPEANAIQAEASPASDDESPEQRTARVKPSSQLGKKAQPLAPAGSQAADSQSGAEAAKPELQLDSLLQSDSDSNQSPSERRSQPQTPRVDAAVAGGGERTDVSVHQRFADHLVSRNVERTDRSPELDGPQQTRLVERVARAFRAAEGNGGSIRIRLSPPELGSVRLDIKLNNGTLSAQIEAETPTARSLLLDNLTVLRERLSEQGIRLDQFDVELADRGGSGMAEDSGDRSREDGSAGENEHTKLNAAAGDEDGERTQRPHGGAKDSQIDVVI